MRLFIIIGLMLLLSGCAGINDRIDRNSRPPARLPAPPQRVEMQPEPLPAIPEIRAPEIVKPYRYKRAQVVRKKPVKRRYKVRVKPKYKAPIVGRYPSGASPKVSQTTRPLPPISVPKSVAVTTPYIENTPVVATAPKVKPEDVGMDIDPYANIPENADDRRGTRSESSPAVKALLVRAYADAKLGRTDAAITKLERGLRIEPQNPKLWNQLAELHYKKGNYQQAITMAKKAINFSSNNKEMTDKNWQLISKVAKKSGDSSAMAEVNEYNKRQ